MGYIFKNLFALIGVVGLLGIGVANAAPSSDCGDDDVKPISVQPSAKPITKA